MRLGLPALAAGLLAPALPGGIAVGRLAAGHGRRRTVAAVRPAVLAGVVPAPGSPGPAARRKSPWTDAWPPSWMVAPLWLEGRVVDLPASGEGVTRFRLEEVRGARGVLLPERLRLSWRGAPPLMGGERWRLAVTLKRPAAW
ncbi:DUF4131 domain-containing protein [Pseudomonas aeruginosa]|nr:DUF4131 domain-containing protein [Pseudomonas aeruginosa]